MDEGEHESERVRRKKFRQALVDITKNCAKTLSVKHEKQKKTANGYLEQSWLMTGMKPTINPRTG